MGYVGGGLDIPDLIDMYRECGWGLMVVFEQEGCFFECMQAPRSQCVENVSDFALDVGIDVAAIFVFSLESGRSVESLFLKMEEPLRQ